MAPASAVNKIPLNGNAETTSQRSRAETDRKVVANQAKATESIDPENTTSTQPNETNHEQQGSLRVFPSPQSVVAMESTQPREMATPLTREVEFTILPDGRMVDLVSSRQPSGLGFLVWQDGNIRRASHIEHDGELLVVPKMDPTVMSALRLPTTARSCPEIGELFMVMMNYIEAYVDITTEYSFLIAAFALSTWFADRLSVAPYLSICGPPESGKTTLLRLLHCLCRRAIHASAVTAASLYRLAAPVHPTLLIDEADFGTDRTSRDFQRLLRGGNRQGLRVLCNGKAFENFGPKVIASRVPLDDAALVSRNINIVMTPSDRDVPSLDSDAEEKLSDVLQPMLEMFRLQHYVRVVASQDPRFLKFPPRLRDNARALAAAMLGNEELQQRLAGALESQLPCMQFDRFNEPEWTVMLALYGFCHVRKGDCYVRELTDETNRILRENGEPRLYSPKRVGQILNKTLGFPTRRRGEGYRVELTLAIARQIHSQARAMGITRADILPSVTVESGLVGHPCGPCSEFGMMMDHEGERLRTFEEAAAEYKPCTGCGFDHHHQKCPRCSTPRKAEMRNPSGEPTSGA
jgi:hypothetical protein